MNDVLEVKDDIKCSIGLHRLMLICICLLQLILQADEACDVTKGCFSDCSESSQCAFIVSWRSISITQIEFEISSVDSGANSWIAIGFSADRAMGSDSVVACVASGGVISAESGYTVGRSYRALSNKSMGLSDVSGSLTGSIMTCSFTRIISIPGQQEFFDLQQNWHILFARGQASAGTPSKHAQIPSISGDVLNFQSISSSGATVLSYPLVKAHGSLMIIAWVFIASIGIFVARYMKPFWPNSTLLGTKVWFAVHRICMGSVMTLTVISFIIIFVEVGGYAHDISVVVGSITLGRLHPVLGIIVTILVIANPVMAMFRCSPDHEKRPIFNFAHRLCGISAHVLAAFAIIFGTYLEKSQLNGIASGVAIAYMWVFVIVNICLEFYLLIKRRASAEQTADIELKKADEVDIRQSLTPDGLRGVEQFAVKCGFGIQILLMFVFALTLFVLLNST